jgi:hypothetical protein
MYMHLNVILLTLSVIQSFLYSSNSGISICYYSVGLVDSVLHRSTLHVRICYVHTHTGIYV